MIDVRRSAERFTTETDWLTSRHSFSFGPHYDPSNVGFAVLVAHNEDVVAPGRGYDTHPHADQEIVTWVLDGSLVHEDSHGHSGVVRPGLAQLMSAGRGVLHSERNDAPDTDRPTRFVQMWLRPDEAGLDPSYAQQEVGPHRRAGAAGLGGRRARRRGADPHRRGGAARRPARAGGVGRRCRTRRTCTCSWPAGPSTWRAPAGSTRATRRGSPGRAGRG